MSIHICWTEPLEEIHRKSNGIRWCFVCRKRCEFDHVVKRPVDPMSWYGPNNQIECTECKSVDSDLFPGTEREWD